MRVKLFILLFICLPVLWSSCVSEYDYESDTGTFTIPWGEKEGQRNPEEALGV